MLVKLVASLLISSVEASSDSEFSPTAFTQPSLSTLPDYIQETIGEYLTPADIYSLALINLPTGPLPFHFRRFGPYDYSNRDTASTQYAGIVHDLKVLKRFSTMDRAVQYLWTNPEILTRIGNSTLSELPLQTLQQGRLSLEQAIEMLRILRGYVIEAEDDANALARYQQAADRRRLEQERESAARRARLFRRSNSRF